MSKGDTLTGTSTVPSLMDYCPEPIIKQILKLFIDRQLRKKKGNQLHLKRVCRLFYKIHTELVQLRIGINRIFEYWDIQEKFKCHPEKLTIAAKIGTGRNKDRTHIEKLQSTILSKLKTVEFADIFVNDISINPIINNRKVIINGGFGCYPSISHMTFGSSLRKIAFRHAYLEESKTKLPDTVDSVTIISCILSGQLDNIICDTVKTVIWDGKGFNGNHARPTYTMFGPNTYLFDGSRFNKRKVFVGMGIPYPVLFHAIHVKNFEAVSSLLNRGADINSSKGSTPLIEAVTSQAYDIAIYLINRGADVNQIPEGGRNDFSPHGTGSYTPLMFYINNDIESDELFTLLLEKGSDVDRALTVRPGNRLPHSPLQQAVESLKYEKFLRMLPYSGKQKVYANIALAYFAANKCIIYKELLTYGADVNECTNYIPEYKGKSLYEITYRQMYLHGQRMDFLVDLFSLPINPEFSDRNYYGSIEHATARVEKFVVERLLALGGNPNIWKVRPAIYRAVFDKDYHELIQANDSRLIFLMLIDHNTNMNIKGKFIVPLRHIGDYNDSTEDIRTVIGTQGPNYRYTIFHPSILLTKLDIPMIEQAMTRNAIDVFENHYYVFDIWLKNGNEDRIGKVLSLYKGTVEQLTEMKNNVRILFLHFLFCKGLNYQVALRISGMFQRYVEHYDPLYIMYATSDEKRYLCLNILGYGLYKKEVIGSWLGHKSTSVINIRYVDKITPMDSRVSEYVRSIIREHDMMIKNSNLLLESLPFV